MPSLIDRRRLMRRAWHLFRTQLGGLKEALANLAFVDSPRAAERQAAEFGARLRALEAAGGQSAYVAKREGDSFALKRASATFARLTPTAGASRLEAPAPLAQRVRFTAGEPLAAALAKIRAADEAIRAGA